MAITIDHLTKVIRVPQSFLTFVSGVLYELDVDALRVALKNLEDDPDGISLLDTHRHVTQIVLSGVVYARSVEIINGYTVEFEDGQYVVRCIGANHNLADVKVANQVSLVIGNSAGLQVVTSGSGVTAQDKLDIRDLVWTKLLEVGLTATDAMLLIKATAEATEDKVDAAMLALTAVKKIEEGRWKIANNQLTVYDTNKVDVLHVFDLKDADGNPSMTSVFERVPV